MGNIEEMKKRFSGFTNKKPATTKEQTILWFVGEFRINKLIKFQKQNQQSPTSQNLQL